MNSAKMEILFILLLVLFNGAFVLSEIALVSARKARLRQWANEGDRRAKAALALAENPRRFLSAIQIGITLVGILAGAYGGATLAESLSAALSGVSALAPYAHALGFGTVVLSITFLTLLFGELVPKRIGLAHPERIAAATAAPMKFICTIAAPVAWFLNASSDLALRFLRIPPSQESPVTEEELKILIQEGADAGTFEAAERDILHRVIRLGNRRISAVMTPRSEVVCLDLGDPTAEVRAKMKGDFHARYPVCRGGLDNIVGVVQSKDLLALSLSGETLDLQRAMRPPVFMPEGTPALKALDMFRRSSMHLAVIVDEYGTFLGVVTLNDLLSSIVGDLEDVTDAGDSGPILRQDGTWLVDGITPVDEFKESFRIVRLPGDDKGYYRTLGGFVMMKVGRIPREGDFFVWEGWRFEVVDMDERRVDKVLVTPPIATVGADEPGPGG